MKLADSDLLRLLPDHISGDPQFAATGQAANPILNKISRSIPNLLIYSRLGKQNPQEFLPPLRRLTEARPGLSPLNTETLEALAWQFHVDFREVAQTNEQLAEMILNSIAWHRIKGTPASIKAALELFGYGMSRTQDVAGRAAGAQRLPRQSQATATSSAGMRWGGGIYIDEHDPGMHWATYQLGFDEVASLDDLALILKICNEMQPARCRLWRVYTSDYDFRPGIWSGKLPNNRWSECWWSGYSGTYFPELPGLDDRGLLVSFGLRRKFLCEAYAPGGVGAGWTSLWALTFALWGYPIWSVSYWGEVFREQLPVSATQIIPLHGCELQYAPEIPWYDAPWQERKWAKTRFWDRRHPEFAIFNAGIPFSQCVWSDAVHKDDKYGNPLKGKPWANTPWTMDDWGKPRIGNPLKNTVWQDRPWLHDNWGWPRSGGWSGENSFWGAREILVTAASPEWGRFRWSDLQPEPVYRRIDEFFYDYFASAAEQPKFEFTLAMLDWRGCHANSLASWRFNPAPEPAWPDTVWLDGHWREAGWPEHGWREWHQPRAFMTQANCGQIEHYLADPWQDYAWPDQAWTEPLKRFQAGPVWPDTGWQNEPWRKEGPQYAASAFGEGAAWQVEALEPESPRLAKSKLRSAKALALYGWPDDSWPACAWRQGNSKACSELAAARTGQSLARRWPACAWLAETWQADQPCFGFNFTSETIPA